MKEHAAVYFEAAKIFKALAHPARIRLLHRLMENECCVSEARKCLGISQPNVSQHLRILKEAGLIAGTRRKTKICYRIADGRIHGILDSILEGEPGHEEYRGSDGRNV